MTEASLGVRVAGVPKGLAVGYSFPAEIAGSVVAAALLVTGLVLLLTRAPPEPQASCARARQPGDRLDRRSRSRSRSRVRDYVIARNAILAIVPAAICVATGYAASRLGLAAGAALCVLLLVDHALGLPRRALRADRLARRGRAARVTGSSRVPSWSRRS